MNSAGINSSLVKFITWKYFRDDSFFHRLDHPIVQLDIFSIPCAPTILTFLEAYQNEPCLWNSKDADHKNRQKINDAWTRLSIIMNKSVKELKTKKEILMATFRRHLKKKNDSIRSGAGSDDVYKPIWFAYDLMESFLGPVYTCSNNVNSEERALSEKNETAAIEDEEVVENNDLEQPLRTPKPVRRRPATDTAERQMSSAFGHLTNILSKRQREYPPPPPKEDDDCERYGKLLAKKLRELSPDERKLFMYNKDTLFINRIKERLFKRLTASSSPHSAPYESYSVHYQNLHQFQYDHQLPKHRIPNLCQIIHHRLHTDRHLPKPRILDLCQIL
ncbi:unnamed protein product [Euphydryas editha]|uniref:MADF domain-containing protein n=1 Tax=Euphydryas editha TaxID=104508 RepID=A0AAU9TPK9_EUPED|nr:unnamed protein product [Euphydryas editha]